MCKSVFSLAELLSASVEMVVRIGQGHFDPGTSNHSLYLIKLIRASAILRGTLMTENNLIGYVPVLGFGIKPFGPNTRPRRPTVAIISGCFLRPR